MYATTIELYTLLFGYVLENCCYSDGVSKLIFLRVHSVITEECVGTSLFV